MRGVAASTAILVVLGGVLAVPSAPADAAVRPTSVTLGTSASHGPRGTPVTLTARVPRGKYAARDHVVFQRRTDAGWKRVARKTLNTSGRVSYRVTPRTSGTLRYRVVKPRTSRYAAATSRTRSYTATEPTEPGTRSSSITLGASPGVAHVGTKTALTAVVPADEFAVGDRVELQRRSASGSWSTIEEGTLEASGRVTWTDVDVTLGTVTYRALKPQTDAFDEAVSEPVDVVGQRSSAIELDGGDALIDEGDSAVIGGLVRPGPADGVVRLMEFTGTWKSLASLPLDSDHRFEFPVAPTVGRHVYQVVLGEKGDFAGAESSTVSVTVRERPAPPSEPTSIVLNQRGSVLRVDEAGGVARTTVDVAAGQKVALAATDIDLRPSGLFSIAVSAPSGESVFAAARQQVGVNERWTFTAPTAGTYTVTLDPEGQVTGSMRLSGSTPKTIDVVADSSPTSLSAEGVVGRELRGRFSARAGDFVSYNVAATSQWRMSTPRVVEESTGRALSLVEGVWEVPRDGSYRLELEPDAAVAPAASLAISTTRASTFALDSAPRSVTLDHPSESRVFRVPVTSGDEVTLAGLGSTDDERNGWLATLVSPAGHVMDSVWRNADLTRTMSLSPGGTYLLIVRPRNELVQSPVQVTVGLSTPDVRPVTLNGDPLRYSTEGRLGRSLDLTFTAKAGDYVTVRSSDGSHGRSTVGEADPHAAGLWYRLVSDELGEPLQGINEGLDGPHWRIPRTGSYHVRANSSGAYGWAADLQVHSATPRPITRNAAATEVSLESPSGLAVYSVPVTQVRTAVVYFGQDAAHYNIYQYRDGFYGSAERVTPFRRVFYPTAGSDHVEIAVTGDLASTGVAPLLVQATTPTSVPVTPNGDDVVLDQKGRVGRELGATFHADAGSYISYDVHDTVRWSTKPARLVHVETGDEVWSAWEDSKRPGPWVAPADGTYRLELEPDSAVDMKARLSVNLTRPVPIALGDEVTASISRPGAVAVYTFETDEWQRYATLRVGQPHVTDSQGRPGDAEVELSPATTFDSPPSDSSAYRSRTVYAVPRGRHVVVVRPSSGATGDVTFKISPSSYDEVYGPVRPQ